MSNPRIKPLKTAACVREDASVHEAASEMKRKGVGCLVVEDKDGHVTGILTDRDLTIRVVAWSRDVNTTLVSEVMTTPVECLDENEPDSRIIQRMSALGVRRIPLTRDGRAVGVVSFDDLAQEISSDLNSLSLAKAGKVVSARKKASREELAHEAEELLGEVRNRLRFANWYAKECFLAELDEIRGHVSEALKGKTI